MDRWYTAAGFPADWAVSSSKGWLIVLNFVKISNWKLEIRRLRNTGSLPTTRILVSSSIARFIVNSQHFFLYSLQTRQIEKVKWMRHDLVAPLLILCVSMKKENLFGHLLEIQNIFVLLNTSFNKSFKSY